MKYIFILFSIFLCNICSAQTEKDSLLEIYHTYVYFESNKAVLDYHNKRLLRTMIDTLSDIKGKNYFIESHTDGVGSVEFNKGLSEERSLSVQLFLVGNGILQANIEKIAFGKTKPIAKNDTEEGKKLNRRSKISVRKKFKLRLLKGKISSDTIDHNLPIQVFAKNKIFHDSVFVDPLGNFEIFIPVNQKIVINALAKDHYSEPIEIIAKDEIFIQPLEMKVIRLRENSVISLKTINFVGDQSIILPESLPSLYHLLQSMTVNSNICFEIGAHINHPGAMVPNEFHFQLSINRAKEIYSYLLNNGINARRMVYKGYSNTKMLFPNPINEFQRKENRRVEITIKNCGDLNN